MAWKIISCLTSGRISGVDIFVIHLTEELRRRGHDARILLTRAGKDEADAMPLPTSAPIETLPPDWRHKRRYRRRALRNYLLAQGPCIYMPNYDFCHSPISARLPESIHTVGILHSDDPMHYDHVRQLGRFWNRVVAVSDRIAQTCHQLKVPAERLRMIPYGVPTPSLFPERTTSVDAPIRLLYVGRIEQTQKRVFDMPLILDRLVARGVPVELTIIGDGPARAMLEEKARHHFDAGRILCMGTIPNNEMSARYREADLFLLTSAFEGLPVSLLEAMAHGCVPVVTRVESGVSQVIEPGRNGELVDVGNIETFADRIEDLFRRPERREELARSAYRTLTGGVFGIATMVDQYESLFDDIAREASSGQYRRPAPYLGEVWFREWQFRIERNWGRLTGKNRYRPPKS
ncbi:glycosyltransferase family 4 protein [bacterium]|nr:glycosyltransferase family 4 protein [bacterium]